MPISALQLRSVAKALEHVGARVDRVIARSRAVDGDTVREFLLRDPRLAATELLVTPSMAVIVAAKR